LLAEGDRGTFTVNLGSARDEHAFAVAGAILQHDVGAVEDGLDRLDRLLHDQAYAYGARHVEHTVRITDQLFHESIVENRIDDETETLVPLEVFHVRVTSGREIVNDRDLVPLADKFVSEMAADEPGPACDEDLHKN